MSNQQGFLKEMGIDIWVRRTKHSSKLAAAGAARSENGIPQQQNPVGHEEITNMNWNELEKAVASCTACPLYKTRTNPVFGTGNRKAKLLIIGEAPGANEDKQGEPFVGRAGQLLNAMLKAIHLSREEVYIANILKSRPPNNRDPAPEEVKACTPYLLRQITLIQPQLLLALGRIASHYLLNTNEPMSALRGRNFTYGQEKTPLIVTYHPAYLLRAPSEKAKAWEDLKRVQKMLHPHEG